MKIYKIAIILGIFLMLIALVFIISEVSSAKKSCLESYGNYSLNLYPFPVNYLCDGKIWVEYSDGWDFERDYNVNVTLLP